MDSKRPRPSGNVQDYMCNCKKYCHGVWTCLSRSTYYNHKKRRLKAIEFVPESTCIDLITQNPVPRPQEVVCTVHRCSQESHEPVQFGPENLPSGSNGQLYNSDFPETFFPADNMGASNIDKHCSVMDETNSNDDNNEEEDLNGFEYGIVASDNSRPHSRTSRSSADTEVQPDEFENVFNSESRHSSIPPASTNIQALEDELLEIRPQVPELVTALAFVRELRTSTLESSGLSPSQINQLRNPGPPLFNQQSIEIFSLKQFVATVNCAENVYRLVSKNHTEEYPDNPMLSFEAVRSKLGQWSGVYGLSINMCRNSCMAFTGPFKNLDKCKFCGTPQYYPPLRNGTRKPLRCFYSMPIGPQVQVLWKSTEMAQKMQYRRNCTKELIERLRHSNGEITEYEDILCSAEYLEAVARGDIGPNDTVFMFAMDGAQLYQSKESDCWIFIFTLLELPPESRYLKKHVMIASCVPGPHKPRHFDSFLFPIFEHISAVNNDGGLKIWDASTNTTFTSKLFFFLSTADGPGSIYFTGLVGHHGTFPCRLFCGIKGRHKPGIPHYYPVLLLPDNYEIGYCAHTDVNLNYHVSHASETYYKHLETMLNATSQTNYKSHHKMTGISKPPLILGLDSRTRLPLYAALSGDAMHVTTLNLGDLLLPLWRGTFARDGTDRIQDWDWAVFRNTALW